MIWGFFFCCVITWILEHHLRSCSTKWIRFSSFFDFANGIPGWHFVVLVEIRPYFRIGKWDNGSKLHCGYLGSSHSQLLWWGFTPTSTCLVTPSRKNDSQLAVVVIIIIIIVIIIIIIINITIVFTKKKGNQWQHTNPDPQPKIKKNISFIYTPIVSFRKKIGVPPGGIWRISGEPVRQQLPIWLDHLNSGALSETGHANPEFFASTKTCFFCGVEKNPPLTGGENFPSYPVIFGHLQQS